MFFQIYLSFISFIFFLRILIFGIKQVVHDQTALTLKLPVSKIVVGGSSVSNVTKGVLEKILSRLLVTLSCRKNLTKFVPIGDEGRLAEMVPGRWME
jgi:hypothetical protein